MWKPDNRLLFLVLTLLAVVLFYSCDDGFLDQPNDVPIAAEQTTLRLGAERLPTPPTGMIYELWASKKDPAESSLTAADLVSIGRFSYTKSDTLIAFLDDSGAVRRDSNLFEMPGDLFSYRYLMVSVELVADTDPAMPGPIMLIDRIIPLEDFKPRLNFPLSDDMFLSTARYNVEGVSDNRSLNDWNDGKGIWFSSYRRILDTIPDTTSVVWTFDSVEFQAKYFTDTLIDTVVDSSVDPWDTTVDSTERIDSTNLTNRDSIWVLRTWGLDGDTTWVDTTQVLYGQDTLLLDIDSFMHIGVRWNISQRMDTIYPYYKPVPSRVNTIQSTGDPSTWVAYDIFTQDDFDLPDISAYGWRYEGWVVTENINYTGMAFTHPAWPVITSQKTYMYGTAGEMLSTGTFTRIDTTDEENPFTLDSLAGVLIRIDTNAITLEIDTIHDSIWKRPRYAGEDFLNSAALTAAFGVGSIPSLVDGVDRGTVFISMEPNNRLTRATNFPLIGFAGELPWSTVGGPTTDMLNLTHSVSGVDAYGLPEILVTFDRK